MGRPVLLPDCNIGHDLTDSVNALLLERGDAREITCKLEAVLDDPSLGQRLGAGARKFALEGLNWQDNSMGLARFLAAVGADHVAAATAVPRAARRFAGTARR